MTKRIVSLALLLALIVTALPAQAAEKRTFVSTKKWKPPVINVNEAKKNEPWLLVLKVAQGEVGYKEGRNDYSKYGRWFAKRNVPWCAEFLSWCVVQADKRYKTKMYKNMYPKYGRSAEGAPWFYKRERFVSSSSRIPVTGERQWLIGSNHYLKWAEYIPYPGDYLWISYYIPKTGTDHVAIVEGVSINEKGEYIVHVIEGNNPDRVQRAQYRLKYGKIYGYGTPVRRANRVMRIHDTCNDIIPVQRFLAAKGFLNYVNGKVFNEKAVDALKRYQKSVGLGRTGTVDMATRRVMEKDPLFQEIMKKYGSK